MKRIGTCEKRDEGYWFKSDRSEQGFIFKDYEAYENDWDAPCYVPEYGFPEDSMFEGSCDYYTHNTLLELCFNNEKLCDVVFHTVDWQHPETYLDELSGTCDFKDFWEFVKLGAKVRWNDPAGLTGGIYEVVSLPEGDEWSLDSVVLISDGYSEAEVELCELERIP